MLDVTAIDQPAASYVLTSAEFAVLLQCARQVANPSGPGVNVPATVDADKLLDLASRHGFTSVLGRYLPVSGVSSELRDRLQEAGRRHAQLSLRLTATLLETIAHLEANGIRCLPYKGPTLSLQVFGDAGIREAVDLDLLVSPRDVRGAIGAFKALGFDAIRPYPSAAMSQLVSYRAEFGMTRDDLLVELQWQLAPRYFSVPFDFEAAWARRVTCTLAGKTIPVLAAEDNLGALCVHGTKHHWEQLKWVLDVDLLVRRSPELDWQAVLADAARHGVLRIILTSLAVAQFLLGTPLPSAVLAAAANDTESQRIAAHFVACIKDGRTIGEREHHRWMLALRERRGDRLRYSAKLAWQPTELEWDVITLPRGLQWLYYPLRLARVGAKVLS